MGYSTVKATKTKRVGHVQKKVAKTCNCFNAWLDHRDSWLGASAGYTT